MKKLFANDKFYLGVALITIICLFLTIVIQAIQAGGSFLHYDWFVVVIYLVCELTMSISYKNHNKNVMKGMVGATLMAIVMDGVYNATVATGSRAIACAILKTIVAILLFITHFVINSDHHSNPGRVTANIVFCILFAVINAAGFIIEINNEGFDIIGLLLLISNIGIVSTIVCIETKVDAFRIDREASGWTEGSGYPKGYVHECEKVQK